MHCLAWLRHLSITWLKQDYLFINYFFLPRLLGNRLRGSVLAGGFAAGIIKKEVGAKVHNNLLLTPQRSEKCSNVKCGRRTAG